MNKVGSVSVQERKGFVNAAKMCRYRNIEHLRPLTWFRDSFIKALFGLEGREGDDKQLAKDQGH